MSVRTAISTAGVLPVPPTVRLPTETTGHGSVRECRTPRSYSHSRVLKSPRYPPEAAPRTRCAPAPAAPRCHHLPTLRSTGLTVELSPEERRGFAAVLPS